MTVEVVDAIVDDWWRLAMASSVRGGKPLVKPPTSMSVKTPDLVKSEKKNGGFLVLEGVCKRA